jgi:Domain of unknown function (DUF6745)
MTINREIRNEWIKTLFSTLPADRPRVEIAAVDVYLAAGFQKPKHLLWFDSPLQASWAVALLLRPHSSVWQQLLASTERTSSRREQLDHTRSDICQQVGTPNWDAAVTEVGLPLGHHWVQPDFSRGFPKMLPTEIQNARIHLYKDVSRLFVSPSDEDDLDRAEQQLFAGARAVLANLTDWHETNSIRSTSFLADYSFSKMATDEAEVASNPAPPLLAAAWGVARSAGLWWPFANAAVLSDRPSEIHHDERYLLHRADGPAVVYRDDTKLYAWHGMSLREPWILHPETIARGELKYLPADFRKYVETRFGKPAPAKKKAKTSDLFKEKLPADPAARLQRLRDHAGGSLPLFERYVAGEYNKVWSELVAMGPAVREEPIVADALAVAYETMRRVEANVRTVVGRLHAMNYRFQTSRMALDTWTERAEPLTTIDPLQINGVSDSPHLKNLLNMFLRGRDNLEEQVAKAKSVPREHTVLAHIPPSAQVRQQIARLEKVAGALPLSLRVFYEVVGSVDWIGSHPTLAPADSDICPDPLVVFPIEEVLEEIDEGLEEGDGLVTIAPDDLHKADMSGGDPYQVAVPDLRADGELLNERHRLFFVDYLRLCFRFGGFPGYEGIDRGIPAEIAKLSEGLLEF